LWQGLGYYTRARNLHLCAKTIVTKHGGKFPRIYDNLRQLPGIGPYTAAAIASFAFDECVGVVDGNVQRVLARIFGISEDVASPQGKKHFADLANVLISKDNPAQHNQAIMEFGALHCVPVNPDCESCIFKDQCVAFRRGAQSSFPVKRKKQKVSRRYFYYFLIRKGRKLLMVERTGSDIWKGLHDFPLHEESRPLSPHAVIKKIFSATDLGEAIQVSKDYKHILTHQHIFARFIEVNLSADQLPAHLFRDAKARWHSVVSLEKIPKPVLISRFLEECSVL
jgi:A/G-specific adenine glycosylase